MSEAYLGEIRIFAGNYAPAGWALCNGQLLSIQGNEALFALLGTTHGGDGASNFALPDLRGRAPVHRGRLALTGTEYPMGSKGGAETVTLTTDQLPAHSHVPQGSSETTDQSPANAVWAVTASSSYVKLTAPTPVKMNAATVAAVGGNQPHDNMQPFLTISYIISLRGLFPQFD